MVNVSKINKDLGKSKLEAGHENESIYSENYEMVKTIIAIK